MASLHSGAVEAFRILALAGTCRKSRHASYCRASESFRRSLIGDAGLSNALAVLEAAAARNVGANDLDVALRLIQDQVGELCRRTLAGGRISGSYLLDRLCLSIGTEYAGVL